LESGPSLPNLQNLKPRALTVSSQNSGNARNLAQLLHS